MAAEVSTANGDDSVPTDLKPPPGVIIPPRDIRDLLERTAAFTTRRGEGYEARIAEQASVKSKLQFILQDNPYHQYYLWRKAEIGEGRGLDLDSAGAPVPAKKVRKGPPEPPEFDFSARMPSMSAVDLDVVKLTALYVAKHGRSWMTGLSQREAQNGQFTFLRPQHSLYNYFSRLVDQYTALLNGATADEGRPQKKRVAELEHNVKDKYHVLERAKQRAEWVKHQEVQKERKAEQEEAEKLAYAQIDWHDFVVVGTIEFTEADDQVDLPPPTSLNDLQSASLEQKAAFSAPVDRRLEEAMPEDFDFLAGHQPPPPAQLPSQSPAPPTPYAPSPQPPPNMSPAPYAPAQAADPEEQARIAERQAEQERARQAQAAATGQGPMRIRNDYVPRAQARRQMANTVLCPVCQQQIPTDEYEKHSKIERLDPRWREQTRIAQARSATTNLSTVDVANNLKRLASQRSDVFDPISGQNISEEEAQRRKRIELSSYDGYSQQQPGTSPAPGQAGRSTDVHEQIRNLQNKYGGQG